MAAKANTAAAQTDNFDEDLEFGADAEIIAPKVDLRRKAKERRSRAGDPDPVAAAEAAMEQMTEEFAGWMTKGAETLVNALKACEDADYSDDGRKALFRAAHDIKGQASTLGFAAVGVVAASLCRLLDCVKPVSRIPRELTRQHGLAIKAITVESKQNVPNAVADQLAARLTTVTDEFIASLG